MKFLLVALLCTIGFNSQAQAACNLASCASGITVDSGASGKNCDYSKSNFTECVAGQRQGIDYCYWTTSTGNCPSGYTYVDDHLNGSKYCLKFDGCVLPSPNSPIIAEKEAQLSEVFEQRSGDFHGWVNGILRSPSSGRGNSAHAKLDACLGYADVDADTGLSSCRTACDADLKNEYCQSSGYNNSVYTTAAVCKDRCECRWSSSSCEGL